MKIGLGWDLFKDKMINLQTVLCNKMAGLMDYDAEENLEKRTAKKSSFRWNFRNAAVCEVQQRQIV